MSETYSWNPTLQWRPFALAIGNDVQLDIECWVAFSSGAPHEFVGTHKTSLRHLLLTFTHNVGECFLINPILKERIPSYNNSGYFTILNMAEIPAPTGPEWLQPLSLQKS